MREEIFSRLPASISVALGAFILWMIALPVGILTALKPRLEDRSGRHRNDAVFLSAPTYWLALVTLFLFASDIGRFKLIGGAGTYVPLSEDPRAWFESLFWPWIVLGARVRGFLSWMIGENLRDAMAQDYVRTARGRGPSERRSSFRHIRAGLRPDRHAGRARSRSSSAERSSSRRCSTFRIGRYAVDAIQNGDLPAIQGVVLFGAIFIVFAILVADILYALRPLASATRVETWHCSRSAISGSRSVREGVVQAVNDVQLTLERGRTLGLVGESGSGRPSRR